MPNFDDLQGHDPDAEEGADKPAKKTPEPAATESTSDGPVSPPPSPKP